GLDACLAAGGGGCSAASHHNAAELFSELGWRNEEADALNNLGELASRTSGATQARDYHSQAPVGDPLRATRGRILTSRDRGGPVICPCRLFVRLVTCGRCVAGPPPPGRRRRVLIVWPRT